MPPRHDRHDRRRLGVVAAIAAVALVVAVVVVASRGDDGTSTSASSSSTVLTTTTAVSTTPSTATTGTAAPVAPNAPPPANAPVPGELPDHPNDYGAAAFAAWQLGDLTSLSELAVPSVVAFLAARPPETGGWEGPQFEGAAGSTYCDWTRPEIQFVVRVRNEAAYAGEPHAVTEAFLWSAPDRVAIWPFTTQQEANDTQEQVDQGHQPWLVDPATVAAAYARVELGWEDATAEVVQTGSYTVIDPESGAMASLALSQPVRTGGVGIWAVTRAGSV
jgi:hypothetical protein